jgi:hypothetical protein
MKLFPCTACGWILHFENTHCENCGVQVGFDSDRMELVALSEGDAGLCRNARAGVCNWRISRSSGGEFCRACELNHTIPNLGDSESRRAWREVEFAKHRLVYTLLRLQLPLVSKTVDPEGGLAFDVIDKGQVVPEDADTTTGHSAGTITLDLKEADPSYREKTRVSMQERYRTLLGHLRHETGHYYWNRLVLGHPHWHPRFHEVFGDETLDYSQALEDHYQQRPRSDWSGSFISAYASAHPWEDWAETWSHYLHLTDTMETAFALGVSLSPGIASPHHRVSMKADVDPYAPMDFQIFLNQAVALMFAVNSLNRSMGQPDLYPFILNEPVRRKLTFIHDLLTQAREPQYPQE